MYRLRCRDCKKRFRIRKLPHQYIRTPKCPDCGSINWRDVDRSDRNYDTKRTCYCTGWPHPHRKGAIVDANRTCLHASIEKVQEAEDRKWHEEELNATTIVNPERCPF